jgi:hypothetical protein
MLDTTWLQQTFRQTVRMKDLRQARSLCVPGLESMMSIVRQARGAYEDRHIMVKVFLRIDIWKSGKSLGVLTPEPRGDSCSEIERASR